MKFLILFLFPFFLTPSDHIETPQSKVELESSSVRVRVCWKGPKGNKTCVLVNVSSGLKLGDEIDSDAFMSGQGGMILRFSDSSISSFSIAESTTVSGCGANIKLREGTKVDVVNGLAIIE